MTVRPHHGQRPHFVGSIDDYEWLACWYGYRANIIPVWRGPGTALVVLSNKGGPLSDEQLREFREVLEDFRPVGADIRVASVG